MTKQCLGCGIKLQDKNVLDEGFTTSLNNDYCRRCFRLKNYGEMVPPSSFSTNYDEVISKIHKSQDLVVLVMDLFNGNSIIEKIKSLTNNMIVVFNKKDILSRDIKEEKIMSYLESLIPNKKFYLLISANKNYEMDSLYDLLNREKTSKYVYFIGSANVGKSTIINKMIMNYSTSSKELTISPLPGTTIDMLEVPLNDDLVIIDTPGLIDQGNISNYLKPEILKIINPSSRIKPKSYQLKSGQDIMINDFIKIEYLEGSKNSFTFYGSNKLKVIRHKNQNDHLTNLNSREFIVQDFTDVVISGLGFIRIVLKGKIRIFCDINVQIKCRKSLL